MFCAVVSCVQYCHSQTDRHSQLAHYARRENAQLGAVLFVLKTKPAGACGGSRDPAAPLRQSAQEHFAAASEKLTSYCSSSGQVSPPSITTISALHRRRNVMKSVMAQAHGECGSESLEIWGRSPIGVQGQSLWSRDQQKAFFTF